METKSILKILISLHQHFEPLLQFFGGWTTVFVLLNAHCAEVVIGCAFIYYSKKWQPVFHIKEFSLANHKQDPRSCPIHSK